MQRWISSSTKRYHFCTWTGSLAWQHFCRVLTLQIERYCATFPPEQAQTRNLLEPILCPHWDWVLTTQWLSLFPPPENPEIQNELEACGTVQKHFMFCLFICPFKASVTKCINIGLTTQTYPRLGEYMDTACEKIQVSASCCPLTSSNWHASLLVPYPKANAASSGLHSFLLDFL